MDAQKPGQVNAIQTLKNNCLIEIIINNCKFEALVDTGASISVIDWSIAKLTNEPIKKWNGKIVKGVANNRLEILGKMKINFFTPDQMEYNQTFIIIKNCTPKIILGSDFLEATKAIINYEKKILDISPSDEYFSDKNTDDKNNHKVSSLTDQVIPPKSISLIKVMIKAEDDEYILENNSDFFDKTGLKLPRSVVRLKNKNAKLYVINPFSYPIKILKRTTIANAESISTEDSLKINSYEIIDENIVENINTKIRDVKINNDLEPADQLKLNELVNKYHDIFQANNKPLKATALVKHDIHTENVPPIHLRPYRVSQKERKIIEDEVNKMLQENIIRPSSSAWSAPVILVKKKDGSHRFCVDYRRLNSITIKDVYPLPRIDRTLDALHGSKYFSSLDLKSGYWQVELNEEHKHKSAFTTPDGLYKFNAMPFGLCNAPSTFERLMDNVLRGLKWYICLCYLDDVVVYSEDFESHLERLETVFKCFKEAGLTLNNKKCRLGCTEIPLFGHIVSKNGISPDPEKIKAIINWPIPKNVKQVRAFLGIC